MKLSIKIFNASCAFVILSIAATQVSAQVKRQPTSAIDAAKKNSDAAKKAEELRKKTAAVDKMMAQARATKRNAIDTNFKGPKAMGYITDAATKKPLAAINVAIPGFSASITDDRGFFAIKVPNNNATLFVSGDGFQAKEIALKGRVNVSAALYEESFNSQYDNAVFPLGQKPQNQSVYAATSINTEGAWGRGTETPDGYLQGKATGLDATMRSGTPTAGASLNIRGYNSLYTANQPLVVVDGMIYDITDYGTSLISNHYTNALANIDTRDIENVTVIKDGTSFYGTKGANGVIVITTVHAKDLATRMDFGVYAGVNFAPVQLPVMKSGDYKVYLTDILKSKGLSADAVAALPYMTDDVTNPNYARYHHNTNWQDEVFNKTSINNNYYIKITGGDDIAKYAITMGYLKNDHAVQNNDLTKYNVRFNADLNLSKKLTANTNLSYSFFEQNTIFQGQSPKFNPIYLGLIKAPFMSKYAIDDFGNVSPSLADTDTLGIGNPASAIAKTIARSKVYRFFGSVALKYEFSKNLSLTDMVGITFDKTREQFFIPRNGIANDTLQNAIADSRLGTQVKRIFTMYNDLFFSYNRIYNRVHSINAKLGMRYLKHTSDQNFGIGYNSATDDFVSVGTGVNALRDYGGDIGAYTWFNNYIGIDYGLQNKYFLSANVAIDASSRFGTEIPNVFTVNGIKHAVSPSLGAAWLVSSENFMAKVKAIDLLKLRVTYSKSGNDDIGNYTAKQTYKSQSLLGLQGLIRANIANPQLQWETSNKYNIGLDVALLNEKINITLDAFTAKTTNMIVYEPAPVASGFDYMITNSGAMKSKGLELAINSRIINTKKIKWDVGLTIANYVNRITQLPQGAIFTSFGGATIGSQVGAPANIFWGLKTKGVFATDDEAAASNLFKRMPNGSIVRFKGGDVRFVNINGRSNVDPASTLDTLLIDDNDRQNIGNPNPDYFGSFFSKFSYKRWSIETFFTFSKGNQVYNGVRAKLEGASGFENQFQSVANRWRAPGQITNMPKATWADPMGNNAFSDRWIEDGSYLRLKSLIISYEIPLKKTTILRSATVYATGNNLLTFTKYLGYDPEFNASESPFARGVDVGLEPQYKSVMLGVRFGL